MYTQFFGNYLLSRGYVTREQLFEAMQKKSTQHMKLGTLAIHAGLMAASEVDSIVIEQTHVDKKFGELAIELGYLTNEQVINLLKTQSPDYLLLGQILVDDGVITNTDLENIITDYRSENEMLDLDMSVETKDDIKRLFEKFFIASETQISELGRMYLELLFNNYIRFVGEDFTPLSVEPCTEFPTDCCVLQEVLGDYALAAYISMDEATAVEFASRYVGDQFFEYDEYVKASLEDFLNLHNGLFIVNCSNDYSLELSISAPEHQTEPILYFEDNAYHIPIMYSFGTVHFILQVKKTYDI